MTGQRRDLHSWITDRKLPHSQCLTGLHHSVSKECVFPFSPHRVQLTESPFRCAVADVVISVPTFHRRAARLFDRWEASRLLRLDRGEPC